ncbi:MAG: neutral/alkaline non-lysosomal ceramidase N-terminal domain-containing protein [Planctomycetes bacterium]|nr:neutral/alkaline non-lysosomal ceramidase N-terminal domain-containing protein [Planctomycetota bacterium]
MSCRWASLSLCARRWLALAVALTGLLFSTLVATTVSAEPAGIRAGAAAVDISPTIFPINMRGGHTANYAEGLNDPLHARAIVLGDGDTLVALVVVDNIGAAPEALDEAKSLAASKTGIPTENMLIASTHTHTGPSSNSREGSAADVAYRKVFVAGTAEAIVKAHAALQPASVGNAADAVPEEVFNRRWYLKPGKMPPNPYGKFDTVKMNPGNDPATLDHPAGPTDPEVAVLYLRDAKKRPLGLLANYALHYVGGMPKARVSADYFGEFARVMPSRVRGDESFVAMMSNGASGDINNNPFGSSRPPREEFEQIRIVAQKTADASWRALQKIDQYHSDAPVDIRRRTITVKLRRPSADDVAAAKEVLAIKNEDEIAKLPRLAQKYAGNIVAAAERPEETLTFEIQAIRIGDFAIVGIPFETFCEIGLELKKQSPFKQTMVIGLANGRHGYLPTPEQHKLGGYETWLGTNTVEEQTSVVITKQLLEMLTSLRKAT